MMQLRIVTTTFLLMTALLSGIVFSASEEKKAGNFLTANNDVSDLNSLQRGARNFFNYCAACHSLKYIRYNQIAEDLDLKKRGLLRKGNFADICIFSLDEISDEATFKKPHQYSRGVEHVIVNGVFVVENNKRTKNTPGRLIRSTVD